jgi:aryl-alcohol dehydrogenase-like predicted oxidoreductase
MLTRMLKGKATAEGTARYKNRFPQLSASGHFRQRADVSGVEDLWFPSLGMGTYLGEADAASDQLYCQAAQASLRAGINLLDSAINYRHQHSERNLGAAVKELIERGEIQRDEFIVCSKAGYLSFDGSVPADPVKYFQQEYMEPGLFKREDVAGHMHCMAPAFLENQLERSRRNLSLETIDVYYVHNPEAQLAELDREQLYSRLKVAFSTLEKAVGAGKIQYYGIASWNSFRVPDGSQPFISLERCAAIAKEVAGDDHHFRFVQLPFNLAMPEAFVASVQPCMVKRCGRQMTSLLESAQRHGIAVVGSASLQQAQLAHNLPEALSTKLGMKTDAERALQFARSAPGILTALVGMGKPAHVKENVRMLSEMPMSAEKFQQLFVANA